ncbi:UNVERIFIED_CONTAM: hypothetical protein Slati_4455400 [Sesamum latifolium]|uniref:Secreted protein n=1 Tax=Sesamum latifolium TaxID=2727402 RepID=A0AAW2SR31_9LAMI
MGYLVWVRFAQSSLCFVRPHTPVDCHGFDPILVFAILPSRAASHCAVPQTWSLSRSPYTLTYAPLLATYKDVFSVPRGLRLGPPYPPPPEICRQRFRVRRPNAVLCEFWAPKLIGCWFGRTRMLLRRLGFRQKSSTLSFLFSTLRTRLVWTGRVVIQVGLGPRATQVLVRVWPRLRKIGRPRLRKPTTRGLFGAILRGPID